MQEHRIGLDFDFWPAYQPVFGGDIWTFIWGYDIHAQVLVHENVGLTFEVPWAMGVVDYDPGGDEFGAAFGHLAFGAYYTTTFIRNPDLAFFAGGTFSVPTHLADDPDWDSVLAAVGAIYARGLYDAHRFLPEHVPIRGRVGIELRPVEWFYFRSEFNPVLHIPIDGETELLLEQGNEIEFRHPGGFGGGFRFQQVISPTNEHLTPNDSVQFALEPYIGYEAPKPAFFFRLGYLWALDEDLGFAFDHGKVAAIRSTFGGKW